MCQSAGEACDRAKPLLRQQRLGSCRANRQVTSHRSVAAIASKLGKTPAQVIFRFALQVGMVALTGTTSDQHMRDDLTVFDFVLDANDVTAIESLIG